MKEESWYSRVKIVSLPETEKTRIRIPLLPDLVSRSDQDSAIYLIPNPTAYGKKYKAAIYFVVYITV